MWGAQWTVVLAAGGTYASRSVLAFVQSPKLTPQLDREKSVDAAPRSVVSLPSDAVAQNSHRLSLEVAGYCVAHPAKAARGKNVTLLDVQQNTEQSSTIVLRYTKFGRCPTEFMSFLS